MLRNVADILWPKIQREVVNTARDSEESSAAGKNDKVSQKQSEFGKIPNSSESNEEIAMHGKRNARKTMFISIIRQFFCMARRYTFTQTYYQEIE